MKWAKANLGPKTYDRAVGIINLHLIPHFDCWLANIDSKMIEEYKQNRAEKVKPATVNRELSRLRHMMNVAVKWNYIKNNPCKGVKELKEPPGRIRYLEPEEYQKLLNACTVESLMREKNYGDRKFSLLLVRYLRPIVEIAAHTGLRRGEILSLERKNIDMKRMLVMAEVTKNGERRAIPMNDTVYRILKELPPRLDSPLLFPDINGDALGHAFMRAVRRAGIEDFRFQDLRHTFASHLTMQGKNLRTVQTLMGHKDLRMTIRYSHLSPEHLMDAVKSLDKVMNHCENPGDEKGEIKSG